MKKRKFNILLNIATLCLCVAAIAFGVYSAKTASLNVSGTIGFTAHNVKANIEAWISGHSDTADGEPITNEVQITANGGLALDGGDASLNLGATAGTGTATRYFSDMGESGDPEDIIVKIKITNTSSFNVLANVNFTDSKATTDKIKIDCDKSASVLAQNGSDTFTFTLKLLQNNDGSYGDLTLTSPTTSNIQIKMNLEKTTYTTSQVKSDAVAIKQFTTEYSASVRESFSTKYNIYYFEDDADLKCYAEQYPYYVEMGQINGSAIKWLIVGTYENDTVIALSDENREYLAKGLLQNKTYVMLSEKELTRGSEDDMTITFQNKYTNSGNYLNDDGFSANDYATSTVRKYLRGETVQVYCADTFAENITPSGDYYNIVTTCNLEFDPVYVKIKGRTLESLYKDSTTTTGTMWTSSYSGSNESLKPTAEDKLWLLSLTEISNIFTTRQTASVGSDNWWIRTPASTVTNSQYIDNQFAGLPPMESYADANYTKTLRPAFLF